MDPDTVIISLEEPALAHFKIDQEAIRRISQITMDNLGVGSYELSVHFTDSSGIRELNSQYRNKDSSTDVLSFPQQQFGAPQCFQQGSAKASSEDDEPPPADLLGDLIISLDDALANARNINQGLDREVGFLLIHGILHLCGHDHQEPAEEKIMLQQQDLLMAALGATGSAAWSHCVESCH